MGTNAVRDEAGGGSKCTGDAVMKNRFALVTLVTEAKQALVQLGFKKLAARAAVEAAVEQLGASATLEGTIRRALRLVSG